MDGESGIGLNRQTKTIWRVWETKWVRRKVVVMKLTKCSIRPMSHVQLCRATVDTASCATF